MTAQKLYMALGNFTRMAENEEWVMFGSDKYPTFLLLSE
jgi:hypothetical protein